MATHAMSSMSASSFTPPGAKTFDPDEGLEHDVFRRVLLGALTGFVSVGVIAFVLALAVSGEVGSAIGIGLFSGFWSGTISGGMVGGLTVINRENMKLERSHPDAAALH